MATNLITTDVSAGDDILAAHHNNMRDDIIKNAGDYEDTAGSANAYTLAIDTGYAVYATGDRFRFKANFSNTGAATLNVNAIGAKAIVDVENRALQVGAIVSGRIYEVVYDGTSMQLIGGPATEREKIGITTTGIYGSTLSKFCMAAGNLYDILHPTSSTTIRRWDIGNRHGTPIQNGSRDWTLDVVSYSSAPEASQMFTDGSYLFVPVKYVNGAAATVYAIVRYNLDLTAGTVMTLSGGTRNQVPDCFWDNTNKVLYISWDSGSVNNYDKYTTSGSPIGTFTFSANAFNYTQVLGTHAACDGTFVWTQNAGIEKWNLATGALVTTYSPDLQLELDNFSDGGNFVWWYNEDFFSAISKTAIGG